MPAVLIRNLTVETHRALKQRAKLHGSSTEAEIREILDAAVRPKKEVGLGTALQELGRKYGGWDLEIKRDKTPARYVTFE
ncbi:MAG: plasmid stability protein [Acidobacteriaceae bacterium]